VSTAAKGRRNEHKTIRLLEDLGYECVRSAASRGTFDVIAFNAKSVKLVQVKSNRWPGSAETEAMELFECPAIASKEVWRWDKFARRPRVKMIE